MAVCSSAEEGCWEAACSWVAACNSAEEAVAACSSEEEEVMDEDEAKPYAQHVP